jgi:hypothetical protein
VHLTDRHFQAFPAGCKTILTVDRRAHRHVWLAGGARSHYANERMTLKATMSLTTCVQPLYLSRSPMFLVHYVCHDESFVKSCARDEEKSIALQLAVKRFTAKQDAAWCPGKLLVRPAIASSS